MLIIARVADPAKSHAPRFTPSRDTAVLILPDPGLEYLWMRSTTCTSRSAEVITHGQNVMGGTVIKLPPRNTPSALFVRLTALQETGSDNLTPVFRFNAICVKIHHRCLNPCVFKHANSMR